MHGVLMLALGLIVSCGGRRRALKVLEGRVRYPNSVCRAGLAPPAAEEGLPVLRRFSGVTDRDL